MGGISMAVDHETVYVGAVLERGLFPALLKYVQPPQGPSVYPRRLAVRPGMTAVFNCFYRGSSRLATNGVSGHQYS